MKLSGWQTKTEDPVGKNQGWPGKKKKKKRVGVGLLNRVCKLSVTVNQSWKYLYLFFRDSFCKIRYRFWWRKVTAIGVNLTKTCPGHASPTNHEKKRRKYILHEDNEVCFKGARFVILCLWKLSTFSLQMLFFFLYFSLFPIDPLVCNIVKSS